MDKPISLLLGFPFRRGLLLLNAVVLLLTTASGSGQTPYFFYTLAGKQGSTGATNFPGPAARFNGPCGVAADAAGDVYVADTANHLIREIALSGTVSTLAGIAGTNGASNGPASTAEFNLPTGVAVDTNGNVYVADWGNHVIRKISGGQVTTLAGLAGKAGWADGDNSTALFNHPAGVAVDSLGQVYVADQGNHAIRIVTPAGDVFTLVGTPGVAGSADGIGTNAQFSSPAGIAYSGFGYLFVADTGNDTIRSITAPQGQWTVTTLAGSPGLIGTNDLTGSAARFNSPTGVATLSSSDVVLVTDFGNNTVRIINLAGQVATLAGSPGSSGTNTGPGYATMMNWPAGIAVDGNANFYIAQRGNDVITEGSPVVGPIIVNQPDDQTSVPGGSATFSVVAMGVQPITYQWKLNDQDLPNAVSPSVEFDDLELDDTGTITVEVVSPYGSLTSSNAQLSVVEPGSFITWAGSATEAGFADGPGGDARLDYPAAVATDTNGNIFVADTGNDVIREIIPSGLTDCTVKTIAGSEGVEGFADGAGTNAFFDNPYGIWVDTNGTIFVADSFNYVVRKIKFDGTNWNVTSLAGNPGKSGTNDGAGTDALFGLPYKLAVGPAGNVYVSDYYNYSLRQVTPDGIVSTVDGSEIFIGGETAGEGTYGLSSPTGLTYDGMGNLIVADDDNNQIFRVYTNAMYGYWDAANYAGEQSDYGGTNDGSQGFARFDAPQDVAGDGHDNYYVADGANTIRKIAPDESVSTIGGIPGMAGSSDGTGTNALFNNPLGVVVDPNGILYVADSSNNAVRKQLPALLIAVQPQTQTTPVNSNATFNVVAAGTEDLTYQWYNSGQPVTGANDSTYTLYGAQTGNVASYTVVVSDSTMSITSSVAKLIVQVPPLIGSGPISETVTNGAKVTFSVGLVGTSPLTYQWMFNGAPIPGQTKTNLVISSASPNSVGTYALAVNGPAGYAISTNAVLELTGPKAPVISWSNPASITYGAPLTINQLNATAKVPGTFAYTPTNGTVLNAGTNTLSVLFTPTDTIDYSIASNTVSLVVSPAPLTVTAANAMRNFGQGNPVFGGAITGVINGDNITAAFNCAATSTSPAGHYPIVPMLVDPDNRAPNYNVTVTDGTLTIVSPLIQSVKQSDNQFSFSWPMATGETYQVQVSTNLAKSWINIGSPIVGSNYIETVTVPISGVLQFYRVVPSP